MSKHENSYRSDIVKLLSPLLAFPVENAADVGTPDICCLLGWIELKKGRDVRRDNQIVHVNVQNSQRIWMRNWCRQGGPGWFLTRLDSGTWALHDGLWGAENLGRVSKKTLIACAPYVSDDLQQSTLVRVLVTARRMTLRTEEKTT